MCVLRICIRVIIYVCIHLIRREAVTMCKVCQSHHIEIMIWYVPTKIYHYKHIYIYIYIYLRILLQWSIQYTAACILCLGLNFDCYFYSETLYFCRSEKVLVSTVGKFSGIVSVRCLWMLRSCFGLFWVLESAFGLPLGKRF